MEDKSKLFKELAKRLRDEGANANIDDLISMSGDSLENSRQTRDLLEQYVGSEMMKNTSIPIDIKNEKGAKKTLERLTEQYTDIKNPKWDVYDIGKDTVGGLHTDGSFGANTRYLDKDTLGQLLAHEPIHKMVQDEGLGKSIPDNIMSKAKKEALKEANILSGSDLAKRGAMASHEIMQLGHLNPTSKSTSSLRNAIAAATGKFGKLSKAIPFIGPALGAAAAINTGEASAAIPILNEADDLGSPEGSLESVVEDPTNSYEVRKKAIEQLSQRRIENGK